jgi:hypothetical protein
MERNGTLVFVECMMNDVHHMMGLGPMMSDEVWCSNVVSSKM